MSLSDGDVVRVESERGAIEAPVRLTGSRPGVVQEDLLGWIVVGEAAKARRDKELRALTDLGYREAERVAKWLTTSVKDTAAQALTSG